MNRFHFSRNGSMKLACLMVLCWACRGQAAEHAPQQAALGGQQIDGAVIYDHDSATKRGDDVFGNVICDFEKDAPGRNSHGGPVCMEYPNGSIVAFHTNASDHNLDGWSEYALSKDGGKTWEKYKKFDYSHEAYQRDPKRPAWVEEGLVTESGTVVLFVTHFEIASVTTKGAVGPHRNEPMSTRRSGIRNWPISEESTQYSGGDTNEYVFFIRPQTKSDP